MKVTFRCKRSGNTVSFINDGDIQGMRKHEGYEEVIENGKSTIENEESIACNPDGSKDDEKANERNEREDGSEEGTKNEGNVLKKRGRKPKN